MFHSATSFNGDISGWDVSSVASMAMMFMSASKFNGDLSKWDVSSVFNMNFMFTDATSFKQKLCFKRKYCKNSADPFRGLVAPQA